ncbi:MAG: RtcB family protein [Candidatus Diapherotrites archaeon]|nr:RtcB family protein [Candidatus Diapherotrites archaeon]
MQQEMKQITEAIWEIPKTGDMNVPARFYGTKQVIESVEEGALRQIKNVACLPGIQMRAMAMPDIHFGYGFPIGGVAAFDENEGGVISPGGIGFDINCGVRAIQTNLTEKELKPKLKELIDLLFRDIPSGVGSKGRLRLSNSQLEEVLAMGAGWAVENGYGFEKDTEHIEENGCMEGADTEKCSQKAMGRGLPQLGTLGSGNHFLEIQRVEEIIDQKTAQVFGFTEEGQVAVMVHCGSRGFGHQVASDYLDAMESAASKYDIKLPDRQLACAPIHSDEAQDYFSAMKCAVNYAFCNREIITHWIREVFERVFERSAEDLEMNLTYDVAHNITKIEEHKVDGKTKKLQVHRKGATRAFAAGKKEIPQAYRKTGHPVIIPGDMGTASYILVGTETAMQETFGSTCHGAGRIMSRHAAKQKFSGFDVREKLASKGQYVRAMSPAVLAEEAPEVYKDIDEVVKSVELAGIARKVVKLKPMGVAKG